MNGTSLQTGNPNDVIQSGCPSRARRKFAIGHGENEWSYDVTLRIFSHVCKVLRLETMQKVLLVAVCSVFLTSAAWQKGVRYTSAFDLFVYCTIYCFWLIVCLPWLLVNVDGKKITLVVGVIGRLFAADIGALAWAAYKGQTQLLLRGLRLKPLFEPSLTWLAEAGYNVRYGVVVACVISGLLKAALETYHRVPGFCCKGQDALAKELTNDGLPKEHESTQGPESRGAAEDTRSASCPSPSRINSGAAGREGRPVPKGRTVMALDSMAKDSPPKGDSDVSKFEVCGGKKVLGRANTSTFRGKGTTVIRWGARSQDRLPPSRWSSELKSAENSDNQANHGEAQTTQDRFRKSVAASDSIGKRRAAVVKRSKPWQRANLEKVGGSCTNGDVKSAM